MPELPEVETMVRGLRPALEGRSIAHARVHDAHLLQGATAEEFERRVGGSTVHRIGRRGKWVVIELGGDRGIIVIQPRMTGGFWLLDPPRPEHIRVSFGVEKGVTSIWFCDARRLGKVAWFPDESAAESAFARSHGPDALEITRDDLAVRLARTSRGIKPTLMDQKVLAGIGNIYADETLFHSRIHPERPASGLKPAEITRLHEAIGIILHKAIEAEGSSFDAGYRTVLGLEGGFLAINAMYGRGGQPCPGCEGPILKTKIAGLIGRPTHYCPTCQSIAPKRARRPKG
ncbi:DNA-formamidopyrimidine glycosylase [Tundrisphaera sp. TA3]|uniref:DNA-formamidopyrimidine glycosylase n=1 Tax=Tundrisphaera sp. TA3 TaxID=3435775 RepID=UPI003EBA9B7C